MIREINISDYEELYNLENEIFDLHSENRPDIFVSTNPLPLEAFKSMLDDKTYLIYGYFLNDNLVGAIYVKEQTSYNLIVRNNKFYFIEDIVVKNNMYHQGIGKELMNFIENKAIENNILNIELSVWAFNENAIKFYEKIGYSCKNLRYEKILNNKSYNNKEIKIKVIDGLE